MEENNQQNGAKPTIDKEYLKKLAEKIKAEKARKESLNHKNDSTPTPPSISSISSKYLDDDDEEMASEKTAIIDLSALSGHPADAKLTIVDGKDTGKNIEITKDEIIAGRSLDNDFVISDSSVSRKHFKITKEGDRFMISDMGSGNGTKINGSKITSATTLSDGDIISAGARQIKFEILNPDLKPKVQAQRVTKQTMEPVYIEEEEEPVKKSSSTGILIAIIIILLAGIGGVAYFMLFDNQNAKPKVISVQPDFGEQDKVAIERMIEAKDLKNAEKALLAANEKTSGDNPYKSWLNEQLVLIGKEKTNQITFENGKTKLAQKNPEGEELLKSIPETSIFYKDAQNLLLSVPKTEEVKAEEPKKEEAKAEPKKEEKKAEPKKEEKKAEPKKEEPKKEEVKTEPKKEEPKKEEKKAEPKKEEPKKEAKKAEPKPAKKKASMSEDEAKKLYMEAKAMEDSDPEEAKKLLQKIINSVDPESKRYKKAKELLEKL